MKFLCDRCKTKYSIADEKVRRKILKIRCKSCGNIITVRDPEARPPTGAGATGGAAPLPLEGALSAALAGGGDGPTAIATELPEFRAEAQGGDDEWYVAIDGEQQGPLPLAQLGKLFQSGKAKGDAFVWRDGFADWMRADAVPELKTHLRKQPTGPVRPLPRREVPRPTDGKLAQEGKTGKTGPQPQISPSEVAAAGPQRSSLTPTPTPAPMPTPTPTPLAAKAAKGLAAGPAAKGGPKTEPREELEDLSDELEDDADASPLPLAKNGGSSPGLFATADAQAAARPTNGTDGSSPNLDLAISEPSRIVKLDAILASGPARDRDKPSQRTGQVFTLPGVDGDDRVQAAQRAGTGPATALAARLGSGQQPTYAPVVLPAPPSQREHNLYKMLAVGGGVATLILAVVVVVLLGRADGTRTVFVEKEKSPEDMGAEFAEQIAREEASKRFGPRSPGDVIPPARSGPPPRRSTQPPPPHGKLAATDGNKVMAAAAHGATNDDRLARLYGDKGPGSETPAASAARAPEDALEPFKRGAKLCLDRALKKDPGLVNAKIDVKISVNGTGGVSGVNISRQYQNVFVGQCLSGVIKHLPWPANGKPYDLEVPLLLSGG
jgi:predicted Zn finger-like uncharacterized protein